MPNDFINILNNAIARKQQRDLANQQAQEEMFRFKNVSAAQQAQLNLQQESNRQAQANADRLFGFNQAQANIDNERQQGVDAFNQLINIAGLQSRGEIRPSTLNYSPASGPQPLMFRGQAFDVVSPEERANREISLFSRKEDITAQKKADEKNESIKLLDTVKAARPTLFSPQQWGELYSRTLAGANLPEPTVNSVVASAIMTLATSKDPDERARAQSMIDAGTRYASAGAQARANTISPTFGQELRTRKVAGEVLEKVAQQLQREFGDKWRERATPDEIRKRATIILMTEPYDNDVRAEALRDLTHTPVNPPTTKSLSPSEILMQQMFTPKQ